MRHNKAMGQFDTPYNLVPVSPVQIQGDSIGLEVAVMAILLAATSSSTVSNTTVETNFTPNATLSANSLVVGQVYRVTARGILSTA